MRSTEQLESDIRDGAFGGRRTDNKTLTHQRAESHHGEEPLQENPKGVHEGAVLAAPVVGALRRAGGHRRVVGGGGGAGGTQRRSTSTCQRHVLQLRQHVDAADSIHVRRGEEEEKKSGERKGKETTAARTDSDRVALKSFCCRCWSANRSVEPESVRLKVEASFNVQP